MQVEIITHSTNLSSDQFAIQIMGRRVGQGYPEKYVIKIDDEPATAYTWTDGVENILSIFLPQHQGKVKEICVVQKGFEPPTFAKWLK